jgi:hypothetical protein
MPEHFTRKNIINSAKTSNSCFEVLISLHATPLGGQVKPIEPEYTVKKR